jgi:hypothetical protein
MNGRMEKSAIIPLLYKYLHYASRKPRAELSSVVDKNILIS